MNFTLGVDPHTNIEQIKYIGIKRVYCGFVDEEMKSKYPLPFFTINWRGECGSFESKESFERFAIEAEQCGIEINVTFNSIYIEEQYPILLEAIDFVSSFKAVTGIIVNDIGLLLRLKKLSYKKNIICSINSNSFNSSIIDFYRQLGATEIVFPRQTKYSEMISVLETCQDINFEVFLIFGNCLYVDGFCSLSHCVEEHNEYMFNPKKRFSNCGIIMNTEYCSIQEKNNISTKKICNEDFVEMITHGCNLCAINKLKKYSNRITYKIVSRGMNLVHQLSPHLVNIRKLEDSIETNSKLVYKDIFGKECNGKGCYISEQYS